MGAEENKALVRRFLTALTEGNLNVIDELISSDFVDRSLLPGKGLHARISSGQSPRSLPPSRSLPSPSMSRLPKAIGS